MRAATPRELVGRLGGDHQGYLLRRERIKIRDARTWKGKELDRVKQQGAFKETFAIAEANRRGARFAMHTAKEKLRLVVQVVRNGSHAPEHWAPTPSTSTLSVALFMGAQHRHAAPVVDISAAFLCAVLP